MRRVLISLFTTLAAACTTCPECPPCKADEDGAPPDDIDAGPDAAIEYTDAGVAHAALGGKPSKVTSYELHGRAGFDKVNIWQKPDMDSPRLGYMRKGQRTRLGDPKFASESCPKGWYKLPEDGFVCQGRGMLVGTKPRYIHRPPPKPRVDELDPYRHGFIRKDWTPVYKRIPTEDEIWHKPEREIDAGVVPDGGELPTEVIPHDDPEDEVEVDGGVDYHRYTKRNFRAVKELLMRGFWVSVASRRFDEATRKYYYETIRGDFIPGNNVHLVRPPTFRGYEVLGESPLPAAIVKSRNAAFYQIRNSKFRGIGPADRLSVYRVYETAENKSGVYYKIEGERWLKQKDVVYFEQREPPDVITGDRKWIYIDLARQSLEAYEGTTPVYATLVSTGLAGDPETETPKGRFHITFKHLTNDMAGTVGDDEVYSVEDVAWVQYIHQNVALHASFWHSRYGTPKSHGCINLSPADARFLFDWSDPKLPPKWHAVSTLDDDPKTLVVIEGKTPK
jgi:lipoprotein-anchoring transpeptidase ErfK/SrfK